MLLCRDIEVACDEKVIKDMNIKSCKAYATALLDCKVNRRALAACPVAFGEVGVGERIRKTLSYKKPAVWIVAFAVVCCVAASACLLTDPVAAAETEKSPATESHRVTAGYTEPVPTETTLATESPTTAPTEPPTEPPTEVQADPYEEGYYDYGYSDESEDYDDSYEESDEYIDFEEIPRLEIEPITLAPAGTYEHHDSIVNRNNNGGNNKLPYDLPVIIWDPKGYDDPGRAINGW